jgi:hypothetical protein
MILKMAKTEDNRIQLLVQGLSRFPHQVLQEGEALPGGRGGALHDIDHKTTRPKP